jgi:predicted nucleic-acid-binding Zn-ribbon protein
MNFELVGSVIHNLEFKIAPTPRRKARIMKSGQCPKCGSFDVRSGQYVPHKEGSYNSNTIPVSYGLFSHNVALDNYVCMECGYVESYISDIDELRMIADKWPRVGSTDWRAIEE